MCTPATEPLRTLTTAGHQSLLESKTPAVADCLFRMLEPHEIGAGMAFTDGYVVLGKGVWELATGRCPACENCRWYLGGRGGVH